MIWHHQMNMKSVGLSSLVDNRFLMLVRSIKSHQQMYFLSSHIESLASMCRLFVCFLLFYPFIFMSLRLFSFCSVSFRCCRFSTLLTSICLKMTDDSIMFSLHFCLSSAGGSLLYISLTHTHTHTHTHSLFLVMFSIACSSFFYLLQGVSRKSRIIKRDYSLTLCNCLYAYLHTHTHEEFSLTKVIFSFSFV
jgi:hypothetical protein